MKDLVVQELLFHKQEKVVQDIRRKKEQGKKKGKNQFRKKEIKPEEIVDVPQKA